MTGAQENAYARLSKDKKKSDVRILGSVGNDTQVQWTERSPLGEDRTVVATISPEGRLTEAL